MNVWCFGLTYTEDKTRVDLEAVSNKELDLEKAITVSARERPAQKEDTKPTRVYREVLFEKVLNII